MTDFFTSGLAAAANSGQYLATVRIKIQFASVGQQQGRSAPFIVLVVNRVDNLCPVSQGRVPRHRIAAPESTTASPSFGVTHEGGPPIIGACYQGASGYCVPYAPNLLACNTLCIYWPASSSILPACLSCRGLYGCLGAQQRPGRWGRGLSVTGRSGCVRQWCARGRRQIYSGPQPVLDVPRQAGSALYIQVAGFDGVHA